MRKLGSTIVEQVIMLVPEFEKVVRKLDQQIGFLHGSCPGNI